jgi:parallel beta-helix repeat protein
VLQTAVWDAAFGRSVSAPVSVTTSATPRYTATATTAAELRDAVARVGAAGGGSVYVAPGTYTLSSTLNVPSDVLVLGAGTDTTTLRAASPSSASLVALTGSRSVLAHVTVDYARGTFDAIEVSRSGNVDDLIQDVVIDGLGKGAKGIELWGSNHHGLSVQDSVISGDGLGSQAIRDSIADTASSDDSVFRTQVSGFVDFGIIFEPYDAGQPKPGPRELAVGNTVRGVQNPATNNGTNEAGIWLGGQDNVAFGNDVSDTGWEGIWTGGAAQRVQVVSNTIRSTKAAGIYLEHQSDNAYIARNDIAGTPVGVIVEWLYGGVGSDHVTVDGNTIVGADYGVSLEVGTDDSVVRNNTILDSRLTAVRLLGVKRTLVQGNDLRERTAGAPMAYAVTEQVASVDGGGTTPADYSTITGNDCRGASRGAVQLAGTHSRLSANVWP